MRRVIALVILAACAGAAAGQEGGGAPHQKAPGVDELRQQLAGAEGIERAQVQVRLSEALLSALSREGADLSVLYGVPVGDQQQLVRADARQVLTVLEEAGRGIGVLIEQVDDDRVDALAIDAQTRVPLYRGRAAVLLAACEGETERAALARTAAGALADLEFASPRAEQMRLVSLAMARFLLGDAERGRELAESALGLGASAEAYLALAALMDDVHEAVSLLDGAGEPFTVDGRADPLLTVVRADAITRLLLRAWRNGGRTDDRLMRDAVDRQAALLGRGDLGPDGAAVRNMVFAKIADLCAPDVVLDRAPPIATLAVALDRAHGGDRDEALRLLGELSRRSDAGSLAAEALWESAVLRLDARHGVDAAAALCDLAQRFPDHARAPDAIRAALAYAGRAERGGETGGRAVYRRALELAVAAGGPRLDEHLYELARVMALDGQAERALSIIERVGPRSPVAERAHALWRSQVDPKLASVADEVTRARADGDENLVHRIAGERLVGLAERAVSYARRHELEDLPRYRLTLADARTDAGRTDGLDIYVELLRSGADVDYARVQLGLARALLNDGRRAEAFAQMRELVEALEASSGEPPQAYWHAWTLMLEMLANDPARAGAVRTHVMRLRLNHPDLGGEPWRVRITALVDE